MTAILDCIVDGLDLEGRLHAATPLLAAGYAGGTKPQVVLDLVARGCKALHDLGGDLARHLAETGDGVGLLSATSIAERSTLRDEVGGRGTDELVRGAQIRSSRHAGLPTSRRRERSTCRASSSRC